MYTGIQEVYDEILAAKAADSNLDVLNSSSVTALWKTYAWVIATVIYLLDQIFEMSKKDINAAMDLKNTHNSAWYANMMFAFQYGDIAKSIDFRVSYDVIDQSKQIIKRVAVVNANGAVLIKVAKEVSGVPVMLSLSERSAAAAYLAAYKDDGVVSNVVSYNADKFRPKFTLYYDGQVPLTTIQSDVAEVISDFLKTQNSQGKFNGAISRISFVDALQSITGAIDIYIDKFYFNNDLDPTFIDYDRIYNPYSGYCVLDATYDLNTELTFIAQ